MLAYLFLEKVAEADDTVEYLAMSSDFSTDGSVQAIARIAIAKRTSTYAFEPLGAWVDEEILDPHFFEGEESDDERAARYRANFDGHKNGAWTARIHGYVTRLIAEGTYPANAPAANAKFQGRNYLNTHSLDARVLGAESG